MFKRQNSIITSTDIEPLRYIENTELAGLDLANSTLLYMLDKETEYDEYTITKYENRADLIARDIYGSTNYSWLIMYINRVDVKDLVRGRKLNVIPLDRIRTILSQI